MRPRLAVIYHSRHGTLRTLSLAAAEGARREGARVRVLQVADEDGPGAAGAAGAAGVARMPRWPERVAAPEDVMRADAVLLAGPTYFGNVSSSLKRFLESATPLWREGLLADRLVTGMTSSTCTHGGREATLLALHQTVYHWGCWVAGADPGAPHFGLSGGNPYGLSAVGGRGPSGPAEREGARELGSRLAALAARKGSFPAPSAGSGSGPVKALVVHVPGDAAVRLMALEAAAAMRAAGARVRLRRLADMPGGPGGRDGGHGDVRGGGAHGRDVKRWPGPLAAPAGPEDVAWADTVLFGAPARLGAVAGTLTGFLQSLADGLGPAPLRDKPCGGFVSVEHTHAGSESALLGLNHLLLSGGALVVPPGYTARAVYEAGGNPYGTSYPLSLGASPGPGALAAVAHQARRAVTAAARIRPLPLTTRHIGEPAGTPAGHHAVAGVPATGPEEERYGYELPAV
ncbi:NAD(P)H-dependent oxidoreductase [Streptomyces sp. NPDC054796]